MYLPVTIETRLKWRIQGYMVKRYCILDLWTEWG